MAKDILVNTNSGDLIISDDSTQLVCWDVVWGKLFDFDESEYMNIVVPSGYINKIQYKDDKFECTVHAGYYPVDKTFLVRLVVKNIATNEYKLIQDYNLNAPNEVSAVYYPTYTGKAQDVRACQLPIIDSCGYFKVLFKRYGNSNFSRAIISSAVNTDFTIGGSDSQSAQLLARCAPGKYYRFPTTGVDLTKYINSVVEHTDMASQLLKQFTNDSKQITDAEFDSNTGDLKIEFIGTDEANDRNLTSPNLLDVELFRVADDDFVRAAYNEAKSITDNNNDYIESLAVTSNFMGIYDIGSAAQLDKASPEIKHGMIDADGMIYNSQINYLASMKLQSGKIYAVCYSPDIISKRAPTSANPKGEWKHKSLFALYKDDTPVYVDEPFYTNNMLEYLHYKESFIHRRCFIPLTDLTVKFYAGESANYLSVNNFGIYPILDKTGNYNSIIGIAENATTGKLTGIVTAHSHIEDVKVDVKTNQIIIIKQNI